MKPIFILALALLAFTGCATHPSAPAALQIQTANLTQIYFNADWTDARQSLIDANDLLETAQLPPEFQEDRAFTLFLGYGRLYAMEHRAGHPAPARAALIKAREWCLLSSQFHGTDPAARAAYVEKYAGPDTLLPFIDKWDRNANHGASPSYLLALAPP